MRTSPRGRLALPLCALFLTLSLAACDKPIDPSAHGTATHAGTARLYLVDEEWPCPTAAKEIVKEVCAAQRRFVPMVHKRDLSDSMKKNLVKSSESFLIRFNSAFIKYIKKAGIISDKGRLIVVASFESTGVSSSLSNATESYVVFGSEGQTRGSFLDFDDWPMVGPVTVPNGDFLLRLVIINSVQQEKEDLKKAVDIVSSLAGSVNPSASMAMKVANPIATLLISMLSDQVIFDHRFALRQSSDTTRSYANELRYGTYALVQQEDVLLEDAINKEAPQSGYVPIVGEMRFDLKSHRLHKMYTFEDQPDAPSSGSSTVAWATTPPGARASSYDISSFDLSCKDMTLPALPTRAGHLPALYNDATLRETATNRRKATLVRTIATVDSISFPTTEEKNRRNSALAELKILNSPGVMEIQKSSLPPKIDGKQGAPAGDAAPAATGTTQDGSKTNTTPAEIHKQLVTMLTAAEQELLDAEKSETAALCNGYAAEKISGVCKSPDPKIEVKPLTEKRITATKNLAEFQSTYAGYMGQAPIGVGPGSEGPIKRHAGLNSALQRMFYESSRSANAQKMSVRYFEKDGKPVNKDSVFDSCTGDRTKRHYLPFSATYYPQYNTILSQYALHTNLVFSVEQVNTVASTIAVRHKSYTDFYKATYVNGTDEAVKDAQNKLKTISTEHLEYRNVIDLFQRTETTNGKIGILRSKLCTPSTDSSGAATKSNPIEDKTTLGVADDYKKRVGSLIGIPNPTCDEITAWLAKPEN